MQARDILAKATGDTLDRLVALHHMLVNVARGSLPTADPCQLSMVIVWHYGETRLTGKIVAATFLLAHTRR